MTYATGRWGWRTTSQRACNTGRGSGGGTNVPLAVRAPGSRKRDSGSHRQANNTLMTQRAAATSPGAVSPPRAANEPTAGPTITPALAAAESHPRALAGSWGGLVPATSACATPVAPPPSPCTNRDTNNCHSDPAKPKITYAIAEALSPTSSAGRRPYRSDTRPHTGDDASCATGKEADSTPMRDALASSRLAYSGSSGITIMSPIMSTKATAMRTDIRFIVSRAPSPDQRCERVPGRCERKPHPRFASISVHRIFKLPDDSWPGLPGSPVLIFLPLHMSDPPPPDHDSRLFRRTLLRVMAVQVATLLLIWLLQIRYTR